MVDAQDREEVMNREELLGYLYGARLEAMFRHEYYTNMHRKWAGGVLEDKIDILVNSYGWVCEARLLSEIIRNTVGGFNE